MYPAIMRMVFVLKIQIASDLLLLLLFIFFIPWMKASQRWIQQVVFESEL